MIKERRRTTGVSRERDDSRKEEKADIWWNEWSQRKILSLSLSSFVSNETTLLIYSVQCSRTKLKMTRSSIFCISFKRIPLSCIPIFTGWISKGIKWRDTTVAKFPTHRRPFVRYFRLDDEYQEIVEMRRDTNANETKGQTYTYYRVPCYETWRAYLPASRFVPAFLTK